MGDRWTFRAFSGFPGISSVSTSHDEPRIEARGPMEGLTEVVARGSGFFPGRGQLLCRFADPSDAARAGNAEVSGVVSTVEAAAYVDARGDEYDAEYVGGTGADSVYRKMRCVTERHPPALGGREALATLAPCVNKTVTVSHDGGGSFSRSDVAFFLFCDVHVSVSGSDVVGTGTPGNPYKTLQRGVEAALAAPRIPETKDQRTFFETAAAAAYGAEGFGVSAFGTAREARKGAARRGGYGYVLNRDRLRLGAGTYAGNGNRGVHPLGKMVEVEAKTPDRSPSTARTTASARRCTPATGTPSTRRRHLHVGRARGQLQRQVGVALTASLWWSRVCVSLSNMPISWLRDRTSCTPGAPFARKATGHTSRNEGPTREKNATVFVPSFSSARVRVRRRVCRETPSRVSRVARRLTRARRSRRSWR